MTQTVPTTQAGQDAAQEASGSTGGLRLAPSAPEPGAAPPARRPGPRKRATPARTPAPAVVDLTAAERTAVPEEALAATVGRSLREHLPALLDEGLQGALAPLARELATAFADVEFSVQRTTVLETRAGVAEARAAAAEQRARTAEDRLDATRARAALLDDQVAALRVEVAGLQAQVRELSDRPRGLLRRRRGARG